jgi:hypothetical protein
MPNSDASLQLILTGDRNRGRHLLKVNHTTIALTDDSYNLLCELIVAMHERPGGFVRCSRYRIQRLRRGLNTYARRTPVGQRLITNGLKNEYRLSLRHEQIVLSDTFKELSATALEERFRVPILRYWDPAFK